MNRPLAFGVCKAMKRVLKKRSNIVHIMNKAKKNSLCSGEGHLLYYIQVMSKVNIESLQLLHLRISFYQ